MAKSFNAQMQARFKTITTSSDKLNLYIHETAMLIVRHAAPADLGGHGDCSMAQRLVMSLPASMRREMLILWFAKYTPIVVKNDEKWAAQAHKSGTKMYVEWDIDGAEAEPFYVLAEKNKEAKPPMSAAKVLELLAGMAKRLEKDIENDKIVAEDVDYVKAIALAVGGLKIARPPVANDQPKARKSTKPVAPKTAEGLLGVINGELAAA